MVMPLTMAEVWLIKGCGLYLSVHSGFWTGENEVDRFIYATHLVFVSVSELKKEFTAKGELVWDKVCVYYKEYDY